MNFGTRTWNLRKAPTDVLPPDTVLLDVTRDEQELLAAMKSKTRYNVRLSVRRGVRVDEAGIEGLDAWYSLYRKTTRRQRIVREQCEYFHEMLRLSERDEFADPALRMLLARDNGRVVAGIILVLYGSHATYLYGASSVQRCRSMPAYRLQWRAIRIAKSRGCESYDLFGIPPADLPSHPMYGLYRFKSGFGGKVLHRMGCWDYSLERSLYNRYRAAELGIGGYHLRG